MLLCALPQVCSQGVHDHAAATKDCTVQRHVPRIEARERVAQQCNRTRVGEWMSRWTKMGWVVGNSRPDRGSYQMELTLFSIKVKEFQGSPFTVPPVRLSKITSPVGPADPPRLPFASFEAIRSFCFPIFSLSFPICPRHRLSPPPPSLFLHRPFPHNSPFLISPKCLPSIPHSLPAIRCPGLPTTTAQHSVTRHVSEVQGPDLGPRRLLQLFRA